MGIPTLFPTMNPSNVPSETPIYLAISPSVETPSFAPTHSVSPPTQMEINFTTTTLEENTESPVIFFVHSKAVDSSQLLYLLIAGIFSCCCGTLAIFILVKKCGDREEENHQIIKQKLSELEVQRMKNLNDEREESVETISLKQGNDIYPT